MVWNVTHNLLGLLQANSHTADDKMSLNQSQTLVLFGFKRIAFDIKLYYVSCYKSSFNHFQK